MALGDSQSFIANVAILNEKLRREINYATFWSKWTGNVEQKDPRTGESVRRPSGSPIEMLEAFMEEGRDNMLIPMIRALTGDPVFGDDTLKGTGESMAMYWQRAYLNQTRKAVMAKEGNMMKLRVKIYKLMEQAKPLLVDYFSKWENAAVMQTFYEGVSPNLSLGTTDEGLGLARRYHPNWYMNDGDLLLPVGTAKQLKTNAELDSAIGSGGACDQDMTAAFMRKLRVKAMELRIPAIQTKDGKKFWVMLVHGNTMDKLMSDSAYISAQQAAFTGKMLDSPELHAADGYYAGFAIFEDMLSVREWVAGDASFFGTTTAERFAPTAASTGIYNSLIFGKSAIAKAIAENYGFTTEEDDHQATLEIGGRIINGYNRNDFFTEANAAEAVSKAYYKDQSAAHDAISLAAENTSSMIVATKDA
jgi:hypothetical protein